MPQEQKNKKRWKEFAVKLGNFQIKLILSIVYIFLLLPYFIVFRIKRLFTPSRGKKASSWAPTGAHQDTIESLRRQF